jgi:UDP-glucose 4-epimerase
MNILVTGGSGFIGSRVARSLADANHTVVTFDLMSNATLGLRNITQARGDATDFAQLLDALIQYKVDRVVHLAAFLGQGTEERPHASHSLNVQGTNNVFEAARLLGLKRVVYASSIAVHGSQSHFGDRAVSEGDNFYPVWTYGAQKVFNEFMGRKYRDKYGVETVAIRIASTYGGGREKSYAAYNSLMIIEAAKGNAIKVPLRSQQQWPLIYIDDCANLFVKACTADEVRHPVYMTGGETAAMADIANAVKRHIPGAQIEFDESASLLPNLWAVDGSLAAKEFGFKCRSLKDGVEATISDVLQTVRQNSK